ncbi:MAG: hypothetical protein VB141_10925 [Burkholderia gladioli]
MASLKFSGGAALEAKLREIANKAGDGSTVRVGFLEDATYPDGASVAYVAAVNEFGNPEHNQPPRAFFRNMIEEKKDGWGSALGKVAVANDYDIDKTLATMGEGIKGQLQASIKQLTDPELAESTVARKGFDKPLVDTGHMMNSVDFEVDT